MNTQEIRLVRRPVGLARAEDFAAHEGPLRALAPGEALVEVRWLSIDPYLNERVTGDRVGPVVPVGGCMVGRGIGRVVEGALPAGTLVMGEVGWRRHAIVSASSLSPIGDSDLPETWNLGVLGVPGLTAWLALFDVAHARSGETLLLTSGAGTVGSIAGQLAREAGLRVIGIASGPAKCAWLRDIGFSAAIDRKAQADLPGAVGGFDVMLDLVGGRLLEMALRCAKPRARVVLCGHVSTYAGPAAMIDAGLVLYQRLRLEGFLVHDHASRFPMARAALLEGARSRRICVRETIHHGLEAAPSALACLLSGQGIGKHLVQVA